MKFGGEWKEVENIIMSVVSQTRKDKRRLFPLMCTSLSFGYVCFS